MRPRGPRVPRASLYAVKQPPVAKTRRKRAPGSFPAVPNGSLIMPVSTSEKIRQSMHSIKNWFTEKRLWEIVIPLIKRRSPKIDKTEGDKVSIRQINWALVGFSKEHKDECCYEYVSPITKRTVQLNVNQVYKNITSGSNTRDIIAPHRRSGEMFVKINDEVIPTTFAQFNYIHKTVTYGIVDWTIKHKTRIKAHMDSCYRQSKAMKDEANEKGVVYKRKALCDATGSKGVVTIHETTAEDLEILKRLNEKRAEWEKKELEKAGIADDDFWAAWSE